MRTTPKKIKDPENGINLSLFPTASDWTPPKDFPNLSGVSELGLDFECRDPSLGTMGPGAVRNDGETIGFSVATRDRRWYFPYAHLGGGNIDRAHCLRFVESILGDNNKTIIGANILYDLEWAKHFGVSKIHAKLIDVQTVEALIDEEANGYSLDAIAKRRLGFRKDETLLREASINYGCDPKKQLWKLHSMYVGPYAEMDALLPLQIWEDQKKDVREQGLETVLKLEMDLIPVLLEMRFRGVPVDLAAAKKLSNEWNVLREDFRSDLFRDYDLRLQTGYEVDQVQSVLDRLGIEYPRTPKTNRASITASYIEEHDHPFLKKLQALREIDRLKGTFVDSLFFKFSLNKRIHSQFKPVARDDGGTRSGRFASSNPNLQQVPSRSSLAPLIRACFVPDEGFNWAKWDYSQQEPRLMLHFAATVGCEGAADAISYMRANPDKKFYDLAQRAANINYRDAKDITLGRMYSMGKKKMSIKLHRTYKECGDVLDRFDTANPYVIDIAQRMMRAADRRGYIRTIVGRRSRFNKWEPAGWREKDPSGYPLDGLPSNAPYEEAKSLWPNERLKRALTHKALNRCLQGSGGDMVKCAMVNMYQKDGYVPYLTVHDELDGPVKDREEAEYRRQMMGTSITDYTGIKMLCPIEADLDYGPHWK